LLRELRAQLGMRAARARGGRMSLAPGYYSVWADSNMRRRGKRPAPATGAR
jgi:hypothetical protein